MGIGRMEVLGDEKLFCSLSLCFSRSLSLLYLDKGKEWKVSAGQKEVKSSAHIELKPQKICSLQSFIRTLFPTMK